jgi:hypothetical protein
MLAFIPLLRTRGGPLLPTLPEKCEMQTISPHTALLILGVMLACTIILQVATAVFVS